MTQFTIKTVESHLKSNKILDSIAQNIDCGENLNVENEAYMFSQIFKAKSINDLDDVVKGKIHFFAMKHIVDFIPKMAHQFAVNKQKFIGYFLASNNEKMAEIQEKLENEDEQLHWDKLEEDLLDFKDDNELITKAVGDQYDINTRLAFQMKFYEMTNGGKDEEVIDLVFGIYQEHLAKIKEKGKTSKTKLKKEQIAKLEEKLKQYQDNLFHVMKDIAEEEQNYLYTDELQDTNWSQGLKSLSAQFLRCKQDKKLLNERNKVIEEQNKNAAGKEEIPLEKHMVGQGWHLTNYIGALFRMLVDENDEDNALTQNSPMPYLNNVYELIRKDHKFCSSLFIDDLSCSKPSEMQITSRACEGIENGKQHWIDLPINVCVQTHEYKKFMKSRQNAEKLSST